MVYLKNFSFADEDLDYRFVLFQPRTCYDSFYPFRILSKNEFEKVEFDEITIFYGDNGSGKSTALNIIAEKIEAERESLYNRSNFYEDYLKLCSFEVYTHLPKEKKIITSDDVFDYILNIRNLNEGIDNRREEIFEEYLDAKYSNVKMESLDDYGKLKKMNQARRKTQSKYVRGELMDNVREFSNGESAYIYFTESIKENGIYLLDEPENSLSPTRQLELMKFIEDSARFYNCQFIISTHSPFLLSLRGAKIYNLDEKPVKVQKWTELESIKVFHDFFELHRKSFDK